MKRVAMVMLVLAVVLATGAVAMAENGPKVGSTATGETRSVR
jgi:hypothetical protein